MNDLIPNGVWPTMITPFTENKLVDYDALEQLIEWYIQQGVAGLFAVCQSSEMFYLNLPERVELAKFIVSKTAGRVPVITSGHISDSFEEQVNEIKQISATGITAFVLVSNRLATEQEDDEVWKKNMERILVEIPDVSFGIYECPYPYKRLVTPELLQWCIETNRFLFLKDTCCDINQIEQRLVVLKDTPLKLFNAHTGSLLASVKHGAAGFSGVMANFHPDLYVWLLNHWQQSPKKAEQLQYSLSLASLIESQHYPMSSKYYLQHEGLSCLIYCRAKDVIDFSWSHQNMADQLFEYSKQLREQYIV